MTSAELPGAVAEVVAKITGYRVAQVDRLSGSAGNQDFMLTTGGGDFVLKASLVQGFAPEAWPCERVRREGVRAPEIVCLETEPQSLPMPFLLMRRLKGRPAERGSPALVAVGQQLAVGTRSIWRGTARSLSRAPRREEPPAAGPPSSPNSPRGWTAWSRLRC